MISVRIITPQGVYLTTKVNRLGCVSMEGALTLLPNHIPMVFVLKTSKLTLHTTEVEEFAVSGGTVAFNDNVATILTDSIERKDEIDLERALRAKQRAEENLAKAKESFEMKQAELALAKAINRINIKKY